MSKISNLILTVTCDLPDELWKDRISKYFLCNISACCAHCKYCSHYQWGISGWDSCETEKDNQPAGKD